MTNTTVKCENFLLAGFGGQGILFAGKLLAYIGLMADKEVSWLPSYGPAMRGGTCNCSVCVSDQPVGSPLVLTPDALIAMNTPSCIKFLPTVRSGGLAVVDNSLAEIENTRDDITVFNVPATRLSRENDLTGMANIIILGKLLKETQLADEEIIAAALKKVIPERKAHLLDANLKALKLGMES
jgi:2-oxoglutarate ferredoxin oxidoreductase subunit gamma